MSLMIHRSKSFFSPLLFLAFMFTFFACHDSLDFPYNNQDGVPEGMVRITLNPNLATAVAVASKGTTPSAYDQLMTGSIRVLVFNGNTPAATLKQDPASATFNMTTERLDVLLNEEETPSYLCVLANLSSTDLLYIESLTQGASLESISSSLRFSLPVTAPILIEAPLVMSGWSNEMATIKKTTTPTSLNIPVTLRRSVARVDIDGSTANFIIEGARMSNAPRYGYTLPQDALPIFGVADLTTYSEKSNAPLSTNMLDQLFCFESKGNVGTVNDHATRVIIKGKPQGSSAASYYPIDIIYRDPLDPANPNARFMADINRNTIYTIKLSEVKKDGYRTFEEAERSEAFNSQVEMDIEVKDPIAYDITTNGKQYLGVTNSEFVIYPLNDQVVRNVHISSVSYTCDPGWSVGTVTLDGGMTISGTTANVGRLDVSRAVTVQDIIVDIPQGFIAGTVVLHIGNLRKEIYVRRMTPTPPSGGVFSDYISATNVFGDYKVGEVIQPSASTSWLKLGQSPDVGVGGSSLNDQVVNPEGGVYVHVEPNTGFETTLVTREASAFIAGEKDNQRIKVVVQQDFFDIYGGIKQIKPYSYVATFHRWDETAGRLIRIYAEVKELSGTTTATEADLWWQADVVAGREFIVLDSVAPDPVISGTRVWTTSTRINELGVGDAPTANYNNSRDLENAIGAQVVGKLRTIRKEGTASIYFRVGMTGKLAGPQAQPRYGLIVITAGVKGKSANIKHSIYVRQGEAADYLMRPWDPSRMRSDGTFDFRSPVRPMARKISPYNLTYLGADGSNFLTAEKNGCGFVEYPSQGGYFFLASGRTVIKPTATGALGFPDRPSFAGENVPWNTDWETCPKGYRRPHDGRSRAYADVTDWQTPTDPAGLLGRDPLYPNDIVESEIRQSLYLYPIHGGFRSDYSNQLQGFIADGYFDRRQIDQYITAIAEEKGPASVETNKVSAAYRGYLVFNPYNFASVFLPFAGGYQSLFSSIRKKGAEAIFQLATAGLSVNSGWTLQAIYNPTSATYNGITVKKGWVFDIYKLSDSRNAHSVRCIKDELPIINTIINTPQTGQQENTVIEDVDNTAPSLLAIRHIYTGTSSLQQQIEGEYLSVLKNINSIAISGDKVLTDEDFIYLNAWANRSTINGTNYSGANLRHLILRGQANATIRPQSFTSPNWSHILLFDAKNISTNAFDGAFTANGRVYNLTLGLLDPITVASGAFNFPPSKVQLHLTKSGPEYKTHVIGNVWTNNGNTYTFQAIKGE